MTDMKRINKRLISAVTAGALLLSGCSGSREEEQTENGTALSPSGLPTAEFDFSEEKYGYCDQTGEWVVEPQFDYADEFSANGLARVESDKKWGYIKPDGEYAIEPRFDYAESFDGEGTACVAIDRATDGRGLPVGGKWGFVKQDGSYLIEPCFDWASGFSADGFARVTLDGKHGYVSRTGEFTADT